VAVDESGEGDNGPAHFIDARARIFFTQCLKVSDRDDGASVVELDFIDDTCVGDDFELVV
jgi:hypothetical protein